ncbi:MAG TPA: hypothetical protein VNB90_00125 [Cytophagaceae bacterium]|jgi:hypothetical protein|nr:hypothetical protein [Cytophagaceae bacterium]
MLIESPKIIKLSEQTLILSQNSSFEYIDPILNVSMTKTITTLTFTQMGFNKPALEIDMNTQLNQQVILYEGMRALIKSCVDNAEEVKDRILNIVLEHSKTKNEEERINIMKMDFMKLKQWFMDDIRNSKIYKNFQEYNSTQKLKIFSKAFNTFILDRNKYTHGQLCLIRPDYTFVLEYVDSSSSYRKRIAVINEDILMSYNNCYKKIINVISEYHSIHQQKNFESNETKNH